jgi:hypothetical protein
MAWQHLPSGFRAHGHFRSILFSQAFDPSNGRSGSEKNSPALPLYGIFYYLVHRYNRSLTRLRAYNMKNDLIKINHWEFQAYFSRPFDFTGSAL